MSDLDVRRREGYDKAISRIPKIKLRPLVAVPDLKEIAKLTDVLPDLNFPINSAGELLDQMGEDASLQVLGMVVDPVRMIKYMPAYYFPVVSYENFVEKMAELIRENRRDFDTIKYSKKMRSKFRTAKFPIESHEQLSKTLEDTPYFNINGRKFKTDAFIKELKEGFFPIKNQKDLEAKALNQLRVLPLIEAD